MLRYVEVSKDRTKVAESFVHFIDTHTETEEGIMEVILEKLKKDALDQSVLAYWGPYAGIFGGAPTCTIHTKKVNMFPLSFSGPKQLFCLLMPRASTSIDIADCRGQSYVKGTNMAGAHKDVQNQTQQVNQLASFVPTCCPLTEPC